MEQGDSIEDLQEKHQVHFKTVYRLVALLNGTTRKNSQKTLTPWKARSWKWVSKGEFRANIT